MTIKLTPYEATAMKQCLHAVTHSWRQHPGMNTGSSQVHNLYWSDIETLMAIHDKFPVEL
jgi:hypothetical protein